VTDDQSQAGGPSRPPPITGSPPMTATRARLGSGRGDAPAPAAADQPEPSQPAGAELAEAGPTETPAAQPAPAASPSAEATITADTQAEGAGSGLAAAAPAAVPAPAGRPRGGVMPEAPVRPAAPPAPTESPQQTAAPAAASAAPAQPEPETEPKEIVTLRESLPDLEWKLAHGYVETEIPSERLLEVAQLLRDSLDYDYLSSITAVDWLDRIELVYHLYSFNYRKRARGMVLRVNLERPDFPEYPFCASLTKLWPGADFQEREVFDLMGIKFIGHPDLRRILLADDFPGHPLRKDFVFDYEYVLVRHLSYGVEGQFAPSDGDGVSLDTGRAS
jgi:NADH-quinone oxidoreductase subunit C